jgi:DNA-binding NarL/FixJ family response regulator
VAPLHVLLAEDNLLLRQGLATLLAEHPSVGSVRTADSLHGLLAEVARETPDVVVTDIRMPPSHSDEGIRAAAELRRTHPGLGVVVRSQYADPELALTLMADGSHGRGYLLKERVADVDQLVAALHSVAAGGSSIDPEVVDGLMSARLRAATPLSRLTARETEVLGLVATGASNGGIAARLHVTPRAVEKHINAIFAKLDMPVGEQTHRRVAAVLMYLGNSGGGTIGTLG